MITLPIEMLTPVERHLSTRPHDNARKKTALVVFADAVSESEFSRDEMLFSAQS